MKKIFFCLTILSLSFLISYGTTVNANPSLNSLKNGDAFSGKNSYYKNANYDIVTSYKKDGEAWQNAVDKMNGISNTDINLTNKIGSIFIQMRSVNTANYTWYGHANWNKYGATLKLNEYTTSKKNFTASNYNKTALHELGHAFYMKHQSSSAPSVMKSGKYAYNDYTSLDKANLRYKY